MARTACGVIAFLSLSMAAIQLRFFFLPIEAASPDMVHHVAALPTAFWLHIAAAPLALALGVAQFSARLRTARPRLHRMTGRTYALAVLIAAVAGLTLALNANGGAGTRMGFGLLAALWAGATAVAVNHAMNGRFTQHRQWMIRSYALTLAAVTLRLEVPVLVVALGTDYTGVLPIIAWACWIPNLIAAEWLIRSRPVVVVGRLAKAQPQSL